MRRLALNHSTAHKLIYFDCLNFLWFWSCFKHSIWRVRGVVNRHIEELTRRFGSRKIYRGCDAWQRSKHLDSGSPFALPKSVTVRASNVLVKSRESVYTSVRPLQENLSDGVVGSNNIVGTHKPCRCETPSGTAVDNLSAIDAESVGPIGARLLEHKSKTVSIIEGQRN